MSQLPRDPRQLARDILSGKVKLEDLAREKARQSMPGGIAPTARVPSPRPPPPLPAPPPVQRPIQNATSSSPAPFPSRPPERRPMPPPPPPPSRQQPQRPQIQRPRAAPLQQQRKAPPQQRPVIQPATASMASRTAAADRQEAQDIQTAKAAAIRSAPLPSGRIVIRKMLQNRQSVRTGILMSEILGPCKAMRDQ